MEATNNFANGMRARVGEMGERFTNAKDNVQNTMRDIQGNVQNTISDVQENVQNTINQYSAPNSVGYESTSIPSASFLSSNSIIAKFAFFVLILIVFILIINLGVIIMSTALKPGGSPYIIYGMLDGNDGKIVPQDPKNTTSIPVMRSNNQKTGVEFTWSVWLNIRTSVAAVPYQHIFNKGDTNYAKVGNMGTAAVNNGPGLYLTQGNGGENTIHVIMDTVDVTVGPQIIDIPGIPYNQWVNVCIRMENKLLDVYVNGVITDRATLLAVPKQNYMDINVSQNGGFSGKLSNLRYYNYALSASEINSVLVNGPTTSVSSMSSLSGSAVSPYFLSANWYRSK